MDCRQYKNAINEVPQILFSFKLDGICWGLLREKLRLVFLGRGSPSAFIWIAGAEGSPFKKTRLFGLEYTHRTVNNIYFCELGWEQSYSSIDCEVWTVTPAKDS